MALHFSVSDVVANVEFDREIILVNNLVVRSAKAEAAYIEEPDYSVGLYHPAIASFHLFTEDGVRWESEDYSKLTEEEQTMIFVALEDAMAAFF